MKTISASALLAALSLGACAPAPEPVKDVTVTPFTAEELNAATGIPGTAIIAASKAENTYVVFYRADAVTDEQIAAAPAKICANTSSNVFATEGVDPTTPEFAEGVKKLSVTCGG